MIKKLTKYGNSLALIVDKPILELLKIDQTTELEISTDGNCLLITPRVSLAQQERVSKNKKIQQAFEETLKQHDATFKKLAKH